MPPGLLSTPRAVLAHIQVFSPDHPAPLRLPCVADVLGRPVVVASQRMGLVEGQLHVMPSEVRACHLPLARRASLACFSVAMLTNCMLCDLLFCPLQPLSPLQEVPDSPAAAAAALLEEEQHQRGGMFSRLLSQLFDQSTWQQDPTWHHGTAGEAWRRCGQALAAAHPGWAQGIVESCALLVCTSQSLMWWALQQRARRALPARTAPCAPTASTPPPWLPTPPSSCEWSSAMGTPCHFSVVWNKPSVAVHLCHVSDSHFPPLCRYLTGCSSGLLHLWQFGEQHALATYTPGAHEGPCMAGRPALVCPPYDTANSCRCLAH